MRNLRRVVIALWAVGLIVAGSASFRTRHAAAPAPSPACAAIERNFDSGIVTGDPALVALLESREATALLLAGCRATTTTKAPRTTTTTKVKRTTTTTVAPTTTTTVAPTTTTSVFSN